MSGKSWHPQQGVRFTKTAGEAWVALFPRLCLFRCYGRAVVTRTEAGNVEVTDKVGAVRFCISPGDEGWWNVKCVEAVG